MNLHRRALAPEERAKYLKSLKAMTRASIRIYSVLVDLKRLAGR